MLHRQDFVWYVRKSAAGKIFLRKPCAAGKTYQRKCAIGKIFLAKS